MYVDTVWNRNLARVNRIIEVIINTHKIDFEPSFRTDAQTLFYSNFYKYYDETDEEYMNFFFICLKNRAKKILTDRIKQNRHSSTITVGEETRDVFETLVCNNIPDIRGMLTVSDIDEYIKKNFSDVEYFVFKHLAEGWSPKDISDMLDVRTHTVTKTIDILKTEIRKLL